METVNEIVINDLLSFLYCKRNVYRRDVLFRAIQDFYSEDIIADAQKILLEALPIKPSTQYARNVRNPNPVIALYDSLQLIQEEDMPYFVCIDLNNVPPLKRKYTTETGHQESDSEDMNQDIQIVSTSLNNEFRQSTKVKCKSIKKPDKNIKKKPIRRRAPTPRKKSKSKTVKKIRPSPRSRVNGISKSRNKIKITNGPMPNIDSVQSDCEPDTDFIQSDCELLTDIDDAIDDPEPSFITDFPDSESVVDSDYCETSDDDDSCYEVEDSGGEYFEEIDLEENQADLLYQECLKKAEHPTLEKDTLQTESESWVVGKSRPVDAQRYFTKIVTTELDNYMTDDSVSEVYIKEEDLDYETENIPPVMGSQLSESNNVQVKEEHISAEVVNTSGFSDEAVNSWDKESPLKQGFPQEDVGIDAQENINSPTINNMKHKYQCSICHRECRDKTHMKRHARMHSREKQYSCPHCDYKASESYAITKHLHIHGKGKVKTFPCPICDKSFAKNYTLQKHMMVHEIRPVNCDKCSFRCDLISELAEHAKKFHHRHRIHSIERPFPCDLCYYRGFSKKSLSDHMRSHKSRSLVSCRANTDLKSKKSSKRTQILNSVHDSKGSCKNVNKKDISQVKTKINRSKILQKSSLFCPLCSFLTISRKSFLEHLRNHS